MVNEQLPSIDDRIQRSKELSQHLRTLYPELNDMAVTKSMLVEHGKAFWPHTYKGVADDAEASEKFIDYVRTMEDIDPQRALLLLGALEVPDQVILTHGASRWFDQGLPVIRLGHKRAAAFMATSFSEETVKYIAPPFRAFYIELPDDLIRLQDSDGTMVKAVGVLVHVVVLTNQVARRNGQMMEAGERWRYAIVTNTHLVQWQLNRPIQDLAGIEDSGNDWEGHGIPLEDYDVRACRLIGKLICATCLMMSNPENLKETVEPVLRNKTGKKPAAGSPAYKVFTERQPIKVDVRRYVRAYLGGERDSPDVRLMVRGHHKMQPHGEKRSLRKLIWVHPYMRGGDENDPIMNSVYLVKDKE